MRVNWKRCLPDFTADRSQGFVTACVPLFHPGLFYFYPAYLEQHIGWASLCHHQDSRDRERPVITTFPGLSPPQSWFMSEKPGDLGLLFLYRHGNTHTHTHTHTHTLPDQSREAYSSTMSAERAFLHARTHTHTHEQYQ